MLELITVGETLVLFAPNAAGPLRYAQSFTKHIAGAESNVAIGLSKLGHNVGFASKVGNDEFGAFVRREVRGEGVDTSQLLADPEFPTGLMFKEISSGEHTEVIYYRAGSAASQMTPEGINYDYFSQARILHLSGITPLLSDSCRRTTEALVAFAKKSKIAFSFDPNIRLKLATEERAKEVLLPFLLACDIALLGLSEAEVLLGTQDPDEIVAILREHGVRHIALKVGSKGSIVADKADAFTVPPYPTESVDSVGAGDAFNAGFLSGLLQDKPLELCGKMGNAMGSIAVSVKGDIEGLADKEQLEALITGKELIAR